MPADAVSSTAARDPPTTRAGGHDDGSYKKLPQTRIDPRIEFGRDQTLVWDTQTCHRIRCHRLQHETPLPHAPGVRMTVVTQTPQKYIYFLGHYQGSHFKTNDKQMQTYPFSFCWGSFSKMYFRRRPPDRKPLAFEKIRGLIWRSKDQFGGMWR